MLLFGLRGAKFDILSGLSEVVRVCVLCVRECVLSVWVSVCVCVCVFVCV